MTMMISGDDNDDDDDGDSDYDNYNDDDDHDYDDGGGAGDDDDPTLMMMRVLMMVAVGIVESIYSPARSTSEIPPILLHRAVHRTPVCRQKAFKLKSQNQQAATPQGPISLIVDWVETFLPGCFSISDGFSTKTLALQS